MRHLFVIRGREHQQVERIERHMTRRILQAASQTGDSLAIAVDGNPKHLQVAIVLQEFDPPGFRMVMDHRPRAKADKDVAAFRCLHGRRHRSGVEGDRRPEPRRRFLKAGSPFECPFVGEIRIGHHSRRPALRSAEKVGDDDAARGFHRGMLP